MKILLHISRSSFQIRILSLLPVTMIPIYTAIFEEHGELPDIITVRRFSGADAQNLQPVSYEFFVHMMLSLRYYSYAIAVL